jgi:hypothetical protein
MVLLLKNKFFILLVFVSFSLLLTECTNSSKTEEVAMQTDSSSSCTVKPKNPNGDSELALLMRKMLSSSKSLKEMIERGEVPKEFPEEFKKIHTAKPTDSETKKASFDGYANSYMNNLEALYHSPKEDLKQNYNAVINACVSCHSEHCPGPLKAINKLKI